MAASIAFAPSGSRALVTGGGSGMGRSIALALSRAGVQVTIMGRRREPLDETVGLAEGAPITAYEGDIRDAARVDEIFSSAEQDGPIPLLLNAASGSFGARAVDISPNGFRAVVDASLTGPFFVLQRWARGLIAAGQPGSAVMITSAFADREEPGVVHSIAAKSGLQSLIRSVAVEWGPHGLRVNAVAPGAVATEGAMASSWLDPAVRQHAERAIALGRFGAVEEIASAALFLLSDGASYVTGASLVVDGGWRLTEPPFAAVEE